MCVLCYIRPIYDLTSLIIIAVVEEKFVVLAFSSSSANVGFSCLRARACIRRFHFGEGEREQLFLLLSNE